MYEISFKKCLKCEWKHYVEGIVSFTCLSNAFNLPSTWQIWHAFEIFMWSTMKAWKTCEDCALILSFLSPGLWADMHLVKKAHINHKIFDLFILTSLSIAYLLIKKQAPRYNKRDRTSPTRRGMIPLLTPRDDIQQDID